MGQEVPKPCILRVGILVEGQSRALFEKIVELCTNAQAMPEQVAEEQIQIKMHWQTYNTNCSTAGEVPHLERSRKSPNPSSQTSGTARVPDHDPQAHKKIT